MLKLSLIADVHHGPHHETKYGPAALPLFEKFLQHAQQSNPDAVIDFGDRITDISPQEDRILLKELAEQIKKISVPRYHLLGNHDVKYLSIAENEEILEYSFASRSFDLKGYHIVLWNANVRTAGGFTLNAGDLSWLEQDLTGTDLPTIIFSHVPLNNGSMTGNFYFEKKWPQYAHYSDDEAHKIRDVIERSEKVILCMNAHTHWNAYQVIDGIHYVTLPSLTETFTTFPHTNDAWADLSIIDNFIEIDIHGRTPMLYRLPIKDPKSHWANMHKAYAPGPKDE